MTYREPVQKLPVPAFGTILRIIGKGFLRSKQNLHIFFSRQPDSLKIYKRETHRHTRRMQIQCYRPSYSSRDPVPCNILAGNAEEGCSLALYGVGGLG